MLDIMDDKQSAPRPEMKDNSPAYGMQCVYFKFVSVLFLVFSIHIILCVFV